MQDQIWNAVSVWISSDSAGHVKSLRIGINKLISVPGDLGRLFFYLYSLESVNRSSFTVFSPHAMTDLVQASCRENL